MVSQKKIREEQLLVAARESNTLPTSTAYYVLQGSLAAAVPLAIMLLVRVMNPISNVLLYALCFAVGLGALVYAYGNLTKTIAKKISQTRRDLLNAAAAQTIRDSKEVQTFEKEKLFSSEAAYQASRLAVAYNNALFFFLFITSSFYFYRNLSETWNVSISITTAAAIVALLSTGTNKA